ncbi:MAG: hypothetical protein ACI31D_02570 [Candidatus Limisoma sp.]
MENYKICFVCTGNACRSPFAECVTKKMLTDVGITGIEVFSLGTLSWGENPRDAVMVEVAKGMGYELGGTTTVMTRKRLMEADAIVVFDEYHRNAVTRELDYSNWDRIILFNKLAFDEGSNVEDPHYQTEAVYHRVAQHIEDGCRRLVDKWKKEPPKPLG